MNDEDALWRIANAIKQSYVRLRKRAQWIQSFTPSDENYWKYWEKAAQICIRGGYDPAEFVEVQFHALRPYPSIQNIAALAAENRYREKRKDYAADVQSKVMLQLATIEKLRKMGRPLRYILEDETQPYDSLFKFTVAAINGLDDIAEANRDKAYARYLMSVHYEQAYQGAIPKEFAEAAARLRSNG